MIYKSDKISIFSKHCFVFFGIPSFLALVVLFSKGQYKLGEFSTLATIITMVGIIGGLLLNFLILIITTNSSVLTKGKNDLSNENLYGDIYLGNNPQEEPRKINNYLFVYYKIFFGLIVQYYF